MKGSRFDRLRTKLRACRHILRGRRVWYGIAVADGCWNDCCSPGELVLIGCRFGPEFTVNNVPALELQDELGDVHVKPRRIAEEELA